MRFKDCLLILIPFLGFVFGSLTIDMFDNIIQSFLGTMALMFTWISVVYFSVLLLIFRKLEGKFVMQVVSGFGIPFVFMIIINYI